MQLLQPLVDRIVRKKAALHRTPLDRYQVRVARTFEEYQDAFRLVHAAYVYQGIESVHASELRVTKQHLLPEATVIVAYEGDELVGTLTITADSPAGLPLDKDYPEGLAALRQQDARLVEYGSYAIVERCWGAGVADLLYIAANVFTTRWLDATHVVIGVHPRATAFYRAVFNFHELAKPQQHSTLQAPVVGLLQDLSQLEAFLRRSYREPMASGRLPVEHFFGAPLSCVDVPHLSTAEHPRTWQMPRAVLQALLRERSDLVAELDIATRRHLVSRRSRATLSLGEGLSPAVCAELVASAPASKEQAVC